MPVSTADVRPQPALDKVLKYLGAGSKGQAVEHRVICAGSNKHNYEMGLDENGAIFAVCDEFSTTCAAPAPSIFATERGVVFYDPHEMHEVMVVDRSGLKPCSFGNRCTKKKCPDGHKFPCLHGVECRTKDTCKFLHPLKDSVVPLGPKYPLNMDCKYGTSCTNSKCHFAHSKGRLKVARERNDLEYTHAPDLEPLDKVIGLGLAPPSGATMFSFQGEFVFFFTPYPGPWAKEYFEKVDVFRYDAGKQKHISVGTWSLEGHYVNAATAQGKVMVISYWPYNDEANRAIWEGTRRERSLGKVIKKQDAKIKTQKSTIKKQSARIQSLDGKVGRLKSTNSKLYKTVKSQQRVMGGLRAALKSQRRQKAEALRKKRAAYVRMRAERKAASLARQRAREERQAAYFARQRAREARRNAWQARRAERVQRAAARARRRRSERWRMLDPIHIYVADGSGAARSDWKLVLDYHKGAHDLELGPAHHDGTPRTLFITENENRFEFDLSVLEARRDLGSLGRLPIVPERLCDGF